MSIATQNVDVLTSQLVLKVGHEKTGTSEWHFSRWNFADDGKIFAEVTCSLQGESFGIITV